MLFHQSSSASLYHGDVMAVLPTLPAGSVQCVVTSPPYFALRSYLPKGDPLKPLEIGSEPTPEAFIQTMVAVFREVRRVLRDDGVCFINLGDSYDAGTAGARKASQTGKHGYWQNENIDHRVTAGMTPGNLLNMPHRVAEALRADGWIWRQTIVWSKRCLSGGTWLYARTAKGDAPAMLKDLVRLDPSTVKLWDGAKWVQVLGWSRTPKGDERRHLEVELRSGERIGCTEDHRWPTDRGVVYTNDLRIGDVIKTCTLPEPEAVQPLCLPDEEFGWLAGFYLAEGCQTEKGVNFSVHANETDAAAKIDRLARLVGGTSKFRLRRGNSAVVAVYSKTLKAFLAEYITGDSCYNKRLSRKAWMRGSKFLAALLDGYLEGDGHWDIHKRSWTFGFCNNDGLAVDLRCLSARLGQVCVLRRTYHTCNGKRFAGWRGRIRSRSGHWNAQPLGKVVAIRNSRAREFWDVSVDQEPNLFALASGVLTHNSPMPESVNGWRWVRCRVKVAAGKSPARNGKPEMRRTGEGVDLPKQASTFPEPAQWSPCPGCPKCEPHGGYVLRRGSGRCTTAHEYVFVMAKSNRYFWDGEASKEAAAFKGTVTFGGPAKLARCVDGRRPSGNEKTTERRDNSSHRNPRTVWTLSSEPTKVRHFATFPSELVRRCLVAGVSAGGCCPHCGAPWAPVVETPEKPPRVDYEGKNLENDPQHAHRRILQAVKAARMNGGSHDNPFTAPSVLGYRPTCDCPPHEASGCVVLDPFNGIGTTGQTAIKLGCRYIGIDLNREYLDVAAKRIYEPPRWWLRKHKPKAAPKVLPGQLSLFSR